MAGEKFGQVVFVDGNAAAFERTQFRFIVVDTNDAMANFSKTRGRYETDVSRSHDCDGNFLTHRLSESVLVRRETLRSALTEWPRLVFLLPHPTMLLWAGTVTPK
jgi:hypothetical protein